MPEETTQGTLGPQAAEVPSDKDPFLNAKIMARAEEAAKAAPGGLTEPIEYLALKYTFTPSRGSMGGAFCLTFEGATGEIIDSQLWLTRPYIEKAFKPSRDWRTFLRMLSMLGPYDKTWGDKLNAMLPELTTPEDRMALFEERDSPNKRVLLRLESHIRKNFERATQCFFDVACELEKLTRSDLVSAKMLEARDGEGEEEPQEDEEEKSFEGTIIQCRPIVDPVWGKPSSEVTVGDILEVGIDGDAGPSALVKDYLQEAGLEPTFPVEEIERSEGKVLITLRISDEIQGIISLTKDLRLKTKRPLEEVNHSRTAVTDLLFFGILAIVLIGLLLAVRYFFL